ncbi:MAG: hypothetical protein QTN59_02535 [Candidatus Electrothrix communis]|nr:MAG: hypothetical protein QTN59_02535 [Candidatus Electrothrix communis]
MTIKEKGRWHKLAALFFKFSKKNMSLLPDAFRRQRKNVMLSSILVAIYFASGAQIEKINILGNIITISNQHITNIIILLFHSYFILRYWQYYQLEENNRRNAINSFYFYQYTHENKYFKEKIIKNNPLKISSSSIEYEDRYSRVYAQNDYTHFFKEKKKIYKKDKKTSWFYNKRYLYLIVRLYSWRRPGTSGGILKQIDSILEDITTPEGGLSALKSISLDDKKIILKINEEIFTFLKTNNSFKFVGKSIHYGDAFVYETYITYNIIHMLIMRVKGALIYFLNNSSFTDYYLPFLLIILSGCVALAGFMTN